MYVGAHGSWQGTEHIWISDDILDCALYRFMRCAVQVRHGSYTPGPLEARKRAAKRRLTNLAQAGEGRAVDLGLLAGLKGLEQQGYQWQAPKPPASEASLARTKEGGKYSPYPIAFSADLVLESPPLPFWLTAFETADENPAHPIPQAPSTDLASSEVAVSDTSPTEREGDRIIGCVQDAASMSTTRVQDPLEERKILAIERHQAFSRKLKWCKTTDSVRQLARELEVDLRAFPTASRWAFRQLLGSEFELRVLFSFLEDSFLNNPEAGNLQHLVTRLSKESVEPSITRPFLKWVKQSTSLGVISEKDILQLARIAMHSYPHKADDSVSLAQDMVIAFSEGLIESSIRKILDLKADTVDMLLQGISIRSSSVELQALGTSIIRSAHEAQLRAMQHGITSFLHSWILYRPISTVPEPRTTVKYSILGIFNLLWQLPEHIACSIMANTSLKLVRYANSPLGKEVSLENLRLWWPALLHSGLFKLLNADPKWEAVKKRLALSKPEILATYLQALDDRGKCVFLLGRWFKVPRPEERLYKFGRVGPINEESFEMRAFDRTLASPSPFIDMFQALRFFHIEVSKETMNRLWLLLRDLGKPDTMIEIIRYQEANRKSMKASLIASVIEKNLGDNPRQAYHIFDSYPNLPLEKVPALAVSMIADAYLHPNTALSFRHRRQRAVAKCSSGNSRPPDRPEPRLHLLQRMCLAYALAPHLPPRLALRKIHECYLTIKRECLGPLSPAITQALVQVGIIRPLQEVSWVSTIKIRWILGLVREVEGKDTADRVDEVVYEWRGKVVEEIRERQRMESRGGKRLRRAEEGYERLWLDTGREVWKPVKPFYKEDDG